MAKPTKTTSTDIKRSRASNRSVKLHRDHSKKAEAEKILVGLFHLSSRGVKLYLVPDLAGGYFSSFDADGVAEIGLGLKSHGGWYGIMGILLHEATEFTMMTSGVRFRPSPDFANDSSCYLFVMDHTQFGEVTARVGEFVGECLADFSTAYKKAIKQRRA